MLQFDYRYAKQFLSADPADACRPALAEALKALKTGTGKGNDFIGWLTPGAGIDREKIKAAAKKIRESADIFVVIGIGGSYMGAKCAVDFLRGPFYNETVCDAPRIYFAGNNI